MSSVTALADPSGSGEPERTRPPFVSARDGTQLFVKDWGEGPPVLFSHGWPLSADMWDDQMMFLAERGFRAIAHDRRGHGRSQQTAHGNDMDSYADDLAAVIETLDLRDVTLVGHSTGGGEVTRYIGRHGSARVARVLLAGAIPPLMLQTPDNLDGTPLAAFDGLREALKADRSQFYRDLSIPFFGANRPGSTASQGLRDLFWLLSMQCGVKPAFDCIHEFSESDFHADLQRIDVPTLFIHGDDDQIVPIKASALAAVKLVPGAQLKIYEGGSHGLTATEKDRFNADLLAFLSS